MISDSDAEVYEKYADELIRFASMLAGPSAAEDLVSDAMMRVFASPGWPQAANHRAYLYRAVMNESAMMARSARRRLMREQTTSAWARDTAEASLRSEVVEAVRSLSIRQRAVVFMTFWLDTSTDEIARNLELSVRTVQRDLESGVERMGRYLHE
jgi:RNA polymerase sigma factor (sigma-70 family)